MSPRGTRALHAVAGTGAAQDAGTYSYVHEVEPVLVVDCWCRARVVLVPRDEVLDGLTRSCGSTACHGPHGEILRGRPGPKGLQGRRVKPLTAAERARFVRPEHERRDRVAVLYETGQARHPFDLALAVGEPIHVVLADLAALREAGRVGVVGPRLRRARLTED